MVIARRVASAGVVVTAVVAPRIAGRSAVGECRYAIVGDVILPLRTLFPVTDVEKLPRARRRGKIDTGLGGRGASVALR
jgi:hypothetical protein